MAAKPLHNRPGKPFHLLRLFLLSFAGLLQVRSDDAAQIALGALNTFYSATGGANWDTSTNWMSGTTDFCRIEVAGDRTPGMVLVSASIICPEGHPKSGARNTDNGTNCPDVGKVGFVRQFFIRYKFC